ncbi:hypothetical protein NQ314_020658 [Rhamnusium bicolor]|uniref:PDZ domain-containing protein n=1 Tax=Rhamnusium bicolor TaxID=1586634 RepID=A0AAV8WKI3_9CUCU|nr:hypothetical protein NQ314_020658 [Rhamnusium bicolor]
MAALPSDSRQPPDGHEFPDFIENTESLKHTTQAYFEDTAKGTLPTFSSNIYMNTHQNDPLDFSERTKTSNLILCHSVSSSNTDLRPKMYDSTEDLKYSGLISEPTNLHTRSQSLIDMSALSKQKNAKWNLMVEQRRKGLSKLKGLVIPETSENDISPSVNIPEIKSQNTPTFMSVPKLDISNNKEEAFSSHHNDSLKSPIVIPPWSTNTSNNLPKYSPAFKRRSLQVYPTGVSKNENYDYVSNTEVTKYCDKTSSRISKVTDDDLNPPKSLESISSPTRSDCSFDYVSSVKKYIREPHDAFQKSHISKMEDESDNDSAVSSSQSSYNSRFSPPPSPTRSCELNHFKSKSEEDDKLNSQNRLLKPSSVEAINRKNILASAKCRSGKDLKIGSPVIRRKQEEKQILDNLENGNTNVKEEEIDINAKGDARILDKVNTAFADVETMSKEIEYVKAIKTPTKIVEIEKSIVSTKIPPKNCIVPIKSPATIPTRIKAEDTKENKSTRDFYSASSILSRRVKPINVKALKENFENFGSMPPPLPQKVPIYKPQITTRNVKAEIAKTENKITSNNEAAVKKIEKVEIKPKEYKPRKYLEQKEEVKVEEVIAKLETNTVVLNLEALGGSLGITLAGGTDYENKEITEPVTEFSLEIEKGKEIVPSTTSSLQRRSSSLSVISEPQSPVNVPVKKATHIISVVKDGAGLGFSIEGGKDSPQGDVPLIVKKIFTGGATDKCGQLKVGDEILFMNDTSFTNLSRIEAWTLMKKNT